MSLKDNVLEILEENKGRSISGNKIAMNLGMTRSAVWKAVKKLREEGYIINAVTNKGYALADKNDILNEPGILTYLTTEHLGRKMDVFKTIDSTNNFAKSLAQLGAIHGTVVISEQQTEGKGRMGKKFHSPSGTGIYMSVILRPDYSAVYAMAITSCAAVAVAEAIENVSGLKCGIKWVNDIYCNNKKLCGILTEASIGIEQGGLDYVVLGIGVNVSTSTFPKELENIATSIKLESGITISRCQLVAEILNSLEYHLGTIMEKDFIEDYRRRSILIGHDITVTKNTGESFHAKCLDIDNHGKLVIKTDDGEVTAISTGMITRN